MRGSRAPRTHDTAATHLTDRDRRVLVDLWRFRYLTTTQLCRLHFSHPKLAQRRLRRLAQGGLVSRFRTAEAATSGFRMWSHHLAGRAVPLVADALGLPASRLSHPTKPPRSIAFLFHHILLTDFRIWLREGCQASAGVFGYRFVPAYEETRHDGIRARRVVLQVPGHSRTLVPDGVFSLDRSDGRRALFCTEIDRGTEPVAGRHPSAIEHKLLTYRAAFEARAERSYETLFHHSFTGFRVLFLVPDEARAASILKLAAKIELDPLVWLATHSLVDRPGRLGDEAWRCEPGGPLHTLKE